MERAAETKSQTGSLVQKEREKKRESHAHLQTQEKGDVGKNR